MCVCFGVPPPNPPKLLNPGLYVQFVLQSLRPLSPPFHILLLWGQIRNLPILTITECFVSGKWSNHYNYKMCWVTRARETGDVHEARSAPISWLNSRTYEPLRGCEQPTGCKQIVPVSLPRPDFRTLAVTGAVGGFLTGRKYWERTSPQTLCWRKSR